MLQFFQPIENNVVVRRDRVTADWDSPSACFGRPPALSPVIDLAVLAIVALMLSTYLRQAKINLAKFQYLKRTITSDPAEGPN